jgi:hypothetical protein
MPKPTQFNKFYLSHLKRVQFYLSLFSLVLNLYHLNFANVCLSALNLVHISPICRVLPSYLNLHFSLGPLFKFSSVSYVLHILPIAYL